MSSIATKTVKQEFYVRGDGTEIPITEMESTHLINSFAKAIREDSEEVIGVLRRELVRRITKDNKPKE